MNHQLKSYQETIIRDVGIDQTLTSGNALRGCAAQQATPSLPPIPSMIERCIKSTLDLEETISVLDSRLGVVMDTTPCDTDGLKPPPSPAGLLGELEQLNNRILGQRYRLNTIIKNLLV